jgi:cytidyltransferase-like protein
MRTVGLVTGCFDFFHEGHRFFINVAKTKCGILVVAVNDDESVRRLKGPDRPVVHELSRVSDVRLHLDRTDSVILFDGDHLKLIDTLKPDVIIRGYDQDNENAGTIPIIRISQLPGFSTTLLTHDERPAR